MPNGSHLNRSKVSGFYQCYICRETKDDGEFYSDHTRYNGCSSRCKNCDNERREARRIGADVKVRPSPAQRISVDNRHAKRKIRERVEEIKALWDPKAVEKAHAENGITRPWTDAETAKLQQMLLAEEPMADIAKVLRRGKNSIRAHAHEVGLKRPSGEPWTDEDDAQLEELMRQDVPPFDIAVKMNRSLDAINAHIAKLPPKIKSTDYCVIKKDAHGLPIWIEKTITYEDGSQSVSFEKGVGNATS